MERIKLESKLKNCTGRGQEVGGFKSEGFFVDSTSPEDLIPLVAPVLASPQSLAYVVQKITLKEYYHAA
ncbi:MAG: hypothetical protein H0U72_02270 [Nitrosospira sp.]|nr:hypothetical protein [Nitrosospira sp.]